MTPRCQLCLMTLKTQRKAPTASLRSSPTHRYGNQRTILTSLGRAPPASSGTLLDASGMLLAWTWLASRWAHCDVIADNRVQLTIDGDERKSVHLWSESMSEWVVPWCLSLHFKIIMEPMSFMEYLIHNKLATATTVLQKIHTVYDNVWFSILNIQWWNK